MRGRIPSDVLLRPEDLALLERVFAQAVPIHDTHPDELAMLLFRLFQEGMRDEKKLLTAAEAWLLKADLAPFDPIESDEVADAVSVTFASGKIEQYDLVVIAEGVGSSTRQLVIPRQADTAFLN